MIEWIVNDDIRMLRIYRIMKILFNPPTPK